MMVLKWVAFLVIQDRQEGGFEAGEALTPPRVNSRAGHAARRGMKLSTIGTQ